MQDAAAANVADGPVAAAVAAKTAVEAEAQADEAAIEKFLASDDFFDADDYS